MGHELRETSQVAWRNANGVVKAVADEGAVGLDGQADVVITEVLEPGT
jgi:hypothetical protein